MKENFLIKKNILSKEVFNTMNKSIFSNEFPWYFLSDSAFKEKFLKKEEIGINYAWSHLLFDFEKGGINSNFYHSFYYPIIFILEKFNFKIENLLRIRIGLTATIGKPVINKPHIDWDFPHESIIFYFNNSDGNTVFYNKDKKSVVKEITPIENMAVGFDGHIFHSSSKPVNTQRRIIMNINLKK